MSPNNLTPRISVPSLRTKTRNLQARDGSFALKPEPCTLIPRDEKGSFRRMSAYVQQDDVMYPYQTVKETLSMASKLRLPNGEGQNEGYRESFVGSLIEQLGLVKATDTVIGDEKVLCARSIQPRESLQSGTKRRIRTCPSNIQKWLHL
jgi:hypothetical protein